MMHCKKSIGLLKPIKLTTLPRIARRFSQVQKIDTIQPHDPHHHSTLQHHTKGYVNHISSLYPQPCHRFSKHHTSFQEEPQIDKKELQRKINLSNLMNELKRQVPNILATNLSKDLISKDVFLRICPSQFDESMLPKLHGTFAYFSACKAIQLFITSVILNPRVKLHITSIRLSNSRDPQCMFSNSTKIYIRWNTCMPNCEHLGVASTSDANLGSHQWSKEDTIRLMEHKKIQNVAGFIKKLASMMMGLTKDPEKLERVLSGLFIFELNDDCDEIIVHTVENMDVIERFEPEEINGLRVC